MDYKKAGVDIEKGEALVDWLSQDQGPQPHQENVVEGIGGFASIFRFDFPSMKEPCLVSATDGVGTKLKLGIALKSYQGLGQDLVAMCANDLICVGAQPLFFLDYFATSQLDLEQAKSFLAGVGKACRAAQMNLMGGETAEMPGLYQGRDFDCAGFAVGVVDRPQILGPKRVGEGSVAYGLASSGFHSNGYSLVRKLFSSPSDLEKWGDALMEPTRLYVDLALKAQKQFKIQAMAHITGGGIDNVARVLPDTLALKLRPWEYSDLFKEAQKRAGLSDRQMLKTFNCGVGFVMILAPEEQETFVSWAKEQGEVPIFLGEVVSSDQGIVYPEALKE